MRFMKYWLCIVLLVASLTSPGLYPAEDGKFILLSSTIGPIDSANDPAGIKGMKDAAAALQTISGKGSPL